MEWIALAGWLSWALFSRVAGADREPQFELPMQWLVGDARPRVPPRRGLVGSCGYPVLTHWANVCRRYAA